MSETGMVAGARDAVVAISQLEHGSLWQCSDLRVCNVGPAQGLQFTRNEHNERPLALLREAELPE